jgi:hypothetical protein
MQPEGSLPNTQEPASCPYHHWQNIQLQNIFDHKEWIPSSAVV